ncbi:helix-turn-helix domain-containing protein [Erythrobacter sp. MTPC3]|uniref:helix-turn-helix domain-containing protein n=1 Tax=Erythrobacter sp. MTPC3 TaxID=3056564 RepID=UPI0036F20D85
MPVQVTLDSVLKQRGLSGKEVAQRVGLSETQLSLFRSNKVRGIRFATLARLCLALECEPGELLSYLPDIDDANES